MDCPPPLDRVKSLLRFVCDQWSVDEEVDHSVREMQGKRRTKTLYSGQEFTIELLVQLRAVRTG